MPFPFFRKKKKEEKKEIKKEEKEEKKEISPKRVSRVKKFPLEMAGEILLSPHVSEKGTLIKEQNQYVFKVAPRANETEIKKAVEALYGVDVTSVRIVKIPKKRRRLGRISGFKKGYKKAIVKLKKNQKIDIFPK